GQVEKVTHGGPPSVLAREAVVPRVVDRAGLGVILHCAPHIPDGKCGQMPSDHSLIQVNAHGTPRTARTRPPLGRAWSIYHTQPIDEAVIPRSAFTRHSATS